MEKEEKRNLTVRIDKEVLDKARKLGLNLSSITEEILKTSTFLEENEIIKTDRLRDAYKKVFIEIIEILKEWGVTYFLIGSYVEMEEFTDKKGKISLNEVEHEYVLNSTGRIEHYIDLIDDVLEHWRLNEKWPVEHIYNSDIIIRNLINLLYKKTEENKDKLEDLEILKNVLDKLKNKMTDKKENDKDGRN